MTATQWPTLTALEPYLWLSLVILFVGWLCTFAVCLADAWLNGGEVPVGRWRMLVIGLAFYGIYVANMPEYLGGTLDEQFFYNAIIYPATG